MIMVGNGALYRSTEQYAFCKENDRQGVGGTGVGLIDTLIFPFFFSLSFSFLGFIFWFDFLVPYIVRAFGRITTTDITHSSLEYTLAHHFPHPFYDL